MARLSSEQAQFLERQGISRSRVLDASALSQPEYRRLMRQLEMLVAIGVAPCAKAGHTMRTSGGHCAQCNTHALAFVRRHHESGDVYVARSDRGGLTKIGTAADANSRMETLRALGYGGCVDWMLQFSSTYSKAGRIELLAQRQLSQYRVWRSYWKGGRTVECQELFNCNPSLAITEITHAAHSFSKVVA